MTTDGIDDTDYIQAFMTERSVSLDRSALIVVDMQNATGARDGALGRRMAKERSNSTNYRFDRIEALVVPNTKRLLAGFRAGGGGVVYLTVGAGRKDAADAPPHMRKLFLETDNYVGSREHEIVDELKPEPGELILRKTSIGAFASTGIDHMLRCMGWDTLFMTGVSTNMCVETTAREAADRGYNVTMVEDACGSTREELHEGTMINFQRLFGRVRSTEQVATELGI
ncbi:MAG: cysteine hydrolase [Rhodospirillaceae bacterium]|nr:cysteine hydrolase [Rhodospirillaceae bacterium]MBT6139931.1 cysteine hydrolase [Rhodospirillaceae bacterium]